MLLSSVSPHSNILNAPLPPFAADLRVYQMGLFRLSWPLPSLSRRPPRTANHPPMPPGSEAVRALLDKVETKQQLDAWVDFALLRNRQARAAVGLQAGFGNSMVRSLLEVASKFGQSDLPLRIMEEPSMHGMSPTPSLVRDVVRCVRWTQATCPSPRAGGQLYCTNDCLSPVLALNKFLPTVLTSDLPALL